MKVHYASETQALHIISGLRKAFGELRRHGNPIDEKRVVDENRTVDDYGLNEFLLVEPGSPYEAWKAGFDETYRNTKNQPEATANEREKLCQALKESFKSEKGWRGLLNRIGKLRIAAEVKRLARTRPSPQIVKSAHDHHVHTLQSDVGAPDAEAVVKDLFSAHALEVEPEKKPREPRQQASSDSPRANAKPKPRPKEQARLETIEWVESTREIVPQRTVPAVIDPPPEPPPQEKEKPSFWGTLLNVAIGIAQEVVVNEQRAAAEAADVSGQWQDRSGSMFNFYQRGANVKVEGAASGYALSGKGRLDRERLELQGMSFGHGPFQASLTVSSDSNRMSGTVRFGMGRANSLLLERMG